MSLTDDEEKNLKHDIRNQISNIVMSVNELKYLQNKEDEYQVFLHQTIENCCKNIDVLLVRET